MAHIVGIDHVGLSSDSDERSLLPVGLEEVTYLPRITGVLLERRFREGDVTKILGGNYLRALKESLPK